MASMLKRAVSVAIVVAVIANMVFFGLGKMSMVYFWAVIAVAAVMAYVILPRMKG